MTKKKKKKTNIIFKNSIGIAIKFKFLSFYGMESYLFLLLYSVFNLYCAGIIK